MGVSVAPIEPRSPGRGFAEASCAREHVPKSDRGSRTQSWIGKACHTSFAAPFVCFESAGCGHRYSDGAGAPGPHECGNHTDLFARHEETGVGRQKPTGCLMADGFWSLFRLFEVWPTATSDRTSGHDQASVKPGGDPSVSRRVRGPDGRQARSSRSGDWHPGPHPFRRGNIRGTKRDSSSSEHHRIAWRCRRQSKAGSRSHRFGKSRSNVR